MDYRIIVTTPAQAIQTTEQLGFYKTAQAMREIIGGSDAEIPVEPKQGERMAEAVACKGFCNFATGVFCLVEKLWADGTGWILK